MNSTLGIDVSDKQLDVALRLDSERMRLGQFTNDPTGLKKMAKWAKNQTKEHYRVCLEATGRYSDLTANFFHNQGHIVHVVNPARISAFRKTLLKRHKTDQEEAKVIAQFGSMYPLAQWSPPTDHQREIQELSRHLTFLKEERTRMKNRLKSGLSTKLVIDSIKKQIALLDKQITKIEAQLISLTKTDESTSEEFELLYSIKGFGQLTAASLLAEVGDFSKFDGPKQLVSHAGLSPVIFESGTSVSKKPRISKTGNHHLRRLIYMPALVAIRHNPVAIAMAERLEKQGKPKKVIICAVMRKLLHIAFGVIKTRTPFDPNYSSVNLQDSP